MKQHITVEQLKQLESDQKVCRLNTLIGHEWDLSEEEFRKYTWYKILEDTAKYCTIGKMIEVLQQKYWITLEQDQGENHSWHVVLYDKEKNTLYHQFHVAKKELCDALWEAIKEVL